MSIQLKKKQQRFQDNVLRGNPPKQYMTNEAQILTVSHAIFKHVSAIHCIACKNISKQFKTKSLR